MNRMRWGAGAVILTTACATASPAVMQTVPARTDSLMCARSMLVARGYDVRRSDDPERMLEAELRRPRGPLGAVREIITATVSGPADAPGDELRIVVRAWEYQAARHDLPIGRQSVREIRPSAEIVADAREVLGACGAKDVREGSSS